MSVKLSDVFTVAELQLAQISIAKASAGCSVFFNLDDAQSISSLSGAVGRRVSLCCFNQELSLLCGQAAFEQTKVAGAHISDTHKCRCGAFYYWVGLTMRRGTVGYFQLRSAEVLSPNSSHLVASHLRTLATIGNIRLARREINVADQDSFTSLDPHHLYGHPTFLSLIRMLSEAGRSLLHAGRCLYFSYSSSEQMLSCEHASDLSQEQTYSLRISLQEFPSARQALDTLNYVVGDKESIPQDFSTRIRTIVGDSRFAVVPLWVVGHVLGFLVYTAVKNPPDKISGTLSLPDFAQGASSLMAVLGYRLEASEDVEDEPTKVGMIQRYAAMGQIAAEIGHDIQASLYGMKNYAYLLSKGIRDDARKITYVRAITEGISYIERLSTEMRKLTGEVRQVTFVTTDLAKVIDSAVLLLSPMAGERGINITKELPEDLPSLMADPIALTEVFLNLGLNAIHSMSDGGEISILVKHNHEKMFIVFQDNGSGITQEILDRFWNSSSYAAKSFTNKGLYIVRRIIHQLQGNVDLETHPGVGTTFFMELWINPKTPASPIIEEKGLPTGLAPADSADASKTALTGGEI